MMIAAISCGFFAKAASAAAIAAFSRASTSERFFSSGKRIMGDGIRGQSNLG